MRSHSAIMPGHARRPVDGPDPVSLLDEDVFRSVLRRERKRTDRSDRAVVLVLVALSDGRRATAASLGPAVADTLTAIKDDTDVLGWLRQPRVIGLIVTDVRAAEATAACVVLEARVRRQLATRLDASELARVSIRASVDLEPSPDALQTPVSSALKRAVDIVGSLTLLLVLAPVFVLIAALVKLRSPGPVFFRQIRIGYKNAPFTMLKFRTMYTNADESLHRQFVGSFITATAMGHPPVVNGLFKLVDDPRVTPVGSLLRRTSLDELPQLWNVLRGDMSLVGPRPPIPYELVQYKGWHRRRIEEAKPGLTGLWQVTGRSRTTFDDMVRLDLRYARSRSLWLDIKLLLATPRAVISGKGAC